MGPAMTQPVMTYDADGDVLTIELVAGADNRETTGEEVSPGFTILYNNDNEIIGFEIIGAIKRVIASALRGQP